MVACELDWKQHTSLLLHSHWLELSYVATREDGIEPRKAKEDILVSRSFDLHFPINL